MSNGPARDPFSEEVRKEASDWFARMRGPEADAGRPAFQAWRTSDPAHAEAYERVLQQWDRSAFLRNTGVGRDRDLSRIARRPLRHRYLAAACATLVTVSAVSIYVLEAPSALSARNLRLEVVTQEDEGRVVTLDDDSKVTVGSRSKLELLFDARVRLARLSRGRVRFEVPRSDPRPLVVEAGLGRIVAAQSTFEVAIQEGGTRVEAIRGVVSVSTTAPDTVLDRNTYLPMSPATKLPTAMASFTPLRYTVAVPPLLTPAFTKPLARLVSSAARALRMRRAPLTV